MNLWKFLAREPHETPEWMKEKWRAAGWKDPDAMNGSGLGTQELTPEQMRAAFAVPVDQLQWRATNQAIEMEIQSALRAALDLTMNPPACANEICAIEHLDRLRRQMGQLRNEGLKVPE